MNNNSSLNSPPKKKAVFPRIGDPKRSAQKTKPTPRRNEDINLLSPLLRTRLCACGCGTPFQPRRIDQVYLNKRHCDFHYNHGRRKQQARHLMSIEKKLRHNERILSKYIKAGDRNSVTCPLLVLQADGFDTSLFTGLSEQQGKKYFALYSHSFQLFMKDGLCYVHIIFKEQ